MNFVPKLTVIAMTVGLFGANASAQDALQLTLNGAYGPPHEAIFYAVENGMYEAEGIDLSFEAGNGSASTARIVAAGNTDIGLADGGAVAQIVSQGAPITIVGLMRQVGGYSFIVRDDSPIETADDLANARIAVPPGTAMASLFQAWVDGSDVDLSNMEVVNVASAAVLNLFADGQIDAFINIPGFVFPQLRERDIEPRSISLAELGVDMFGHGFIVRNDYLEENRDLIARFLDVTFAALSETMQNPVEAAEIMVREAPTSGPVEKATYIINDYSRTSYCSEQSPGLGRPSDDMLAVNFGVMHSFMGIDDAITQETLFDFSMLPDPLIACPDLN